MYDRVLTGRVVTPSGLIEGGWIAIAGEQIAGVGTGVPPAAAERFEYGDAYLLPGVIDGQTHAGSQIGFPGLAPTSRAARGRTVPPPWSCPAGRPWSHPAWNSPQ